MGAQPRSAQRVIPYSLIVARGCSGVTMTASRRKGLALMSVSILGEQLVSSLGSELPVAIEPPAELRQDVLAGGDVMPPVYCRVLCGSTEIAHPPL